MRSDNPMIAQHEEGMTQEKKFSTIPARDKAGVILAWLTEHKARDVAAFELAGNPLTDAIIVASASSARHTRSLADGLLELCDRERYEFLRMEGYQGGMWVLADLNDIIVHIFQEPVRELYNLESLWRGAEPLEVPAGPGNASPSLPGGLPGGEAGRGEHA